VYRRLLLLGVLPVLFCAGCGNRCWVCEKEKDVLDIEDHTEELVEVAFESSKGMGDLLGHAFVQYKNAHQGTFKEGRFIHVQIVDEEFIRLLSHNAVLNPYLKICDADNDLFITDLEVKQFNEKHTTKE
jgi:hypothetical protein